MNRDDICVNGMVFAENDAYVLSRYKETEQELFFKAWRETFEHSLLLMNTQLEQTSWEKALSDLNTLQLKVMDKREQEYVGEVCLMKLNSEMPELGIQLLRKYQGQGIGTQVMNLFIKQLKAVTEFKEFLIKISSDNVASKKLFEKMGAVRIGEEGKEYAELMCKIMQKMGKEKFEEIIKGDFAKTQEYTVCYKLMS